MAEVASDLIGNIEGYQQLLTTLSLGICAGTFALVTQVIFHNAANAARVQLSGLSLIMAAVIALVLSILAGVATKSVLVSSVPAMHAIAWSDQSATTQLAAAGLGGLMTFASLQIALFLVAILCLGFALLANLRLLR